MEQIAQTVKHIMKSYFEEEFGGGPYFDLVDAPRKVKTDVAQKYLSLLPNDDSREILLEAMGEADISGAVLFNFPLDGCRVIVEALTEEVTKRIASRFNTIYHRERTNNEQYNLSEAI